MSEPLYKHSYEYAVENNEIEKWRTNRKADKECKAGIEKILSERFDGMHLDKDIAVDLCKEYGIDRVGWVLANTVMNQLWDGRFRQENKIWANSYDVPTDKNERSYEYSVSSHPEIVNGLINQYKKYCDSICYTEDDEHEQNEDGGMS
ncbi:MAG: hypothetical protein A2Y17_10485 [Clostridiales bacterium GWF2_38_85]|nr:MAG: hypothetical protein A2Y17_10485 [Clostridiales bacterium GWF2_38_85]